jgi:hypothetical protein
MPKVLFQPLRRVKPKVLLVTWLATSLAGTENGVAAEATVPSAEGIEFFETHIRPVLVEKCYECHSAKAKIVQGGLRLDSAENMRHGGDSGAVLLPNKPDESPLISALRWESHEMPPTGKLPQAVIDDFAKWVSMGAPDPRSDSTPPIDNTKPSDPFDHWAYKPPQRGTPPAVKDEGAIRNDVDRYIVAKLESAGLTPSSQAAPRALLRRLYDGLIGLPPSADELDEFAADPTAARYEATVDRLLASPRFGERWARHWLDLARYADTKGYVFEEDRSFKGAFKYRDWVINSFNNDRPYDKFVIAQIAGEQVDDPSCGPASGYLTLGRQFLKAQPDIINDRIDVITRGLLGLTVACARCHDHKYDAITAADYYALYGVFASSTEVPSDEAPPALNDAPTPVEPVVFLRGNPGNPGPKVDRRFLTCLATEHKPAAFKHGSGRLELGQAIASRDNPLTARVWVNRIWAHLFGAGLVATTSDFGTRGTPPTHPELLDWLACELMDNGWSTKQLIRRIVTTGTYRQASDARPECVALDPENHLLWRANRRRLDLEALRDSLLFAAGRLDEKMGGPSVSLTDAPYSTRRAVYGYIERQNLPAFFRTFDFANPNTHTPERPQTTAPQQALYLMNSPFSMEQAVYVAARSDEAGAADAAGRVRRINRLFRHVLGREPAIDELADALAFVDVGDSPAIAKTAHQLAWQFGWGTCDEATGAVAFQPLPHFTGDTWQGSAKWPDPTLGWAMLSATGGHPGDAAHAVIRRWTAPLAGTLHIEGVLAHTPQQGEGIRSRVVISKKRVVGTWQAHHGEHATNVQPVAVEPGDTVDFITDCGPTLDNDQFNWTVTLRLARSASEPGQVWDSASGFHGPLQFPLTRWQELAQVLLMSNEFVFVD